jgi:ADP-heptose:LPS heptosyltransferase
VRAMALEAWPTPADRAAWIGEWPPVEGLMALAGVVASLDLVISVDTMCAHLAGALGVPVWTLLQHEADWRWMEGRDDSPWYPTMRLFRQTRTDDWPALAERVRDACADLPRRAGQGR